MQNAQISEQARAGAGTGSVLLDLHPRPSHLAEPLEVEQKLSRSSRRYISLIRGTAVYWHKGRSPQQIQYGDLTVFYKVLLRAAAHAKLEAKPAPTITQSPSCHHTSRGGHAEAGLPVLSHFGSASDCLQFCTLRRAVCMPFPPCSTSLAECIWGTLFNGLAEFYL